MCSVCLPLTALRAQTGYIDYDKLEEKALDYRPKLIICGGSAYPREWEYKRLWQIAKSVGAYLLMDMAHIRCAQPARAEPLRLPPTAPAGAQCVTPGKADAAPRRPALRRWPSPARQALTCVWRAAVAWWQQRRPPSPLSTATL